jgi:purine-binding chemotaxis protein CheW
MMATAARSVSTLAIEPARDATDLLQIVTFRIGTELFAADVRAVERVLRYQTSTPLPDVPAWIVGVLEYQQRVVPVIDLRLRFGLSVAAVTGDTRIIVFNTAAGWTAGIVDAVLDVSAIESGRLEAPPPLLHGLAAVYLHGIARRDGQLVLLLNADRVLSSTDQSILQQRVADVVRERRPRRV